MLSLKVRHGTRVPSETAPEVRDRCFRSELVPSHHSLPRSNYRPCIRFVVSCFEKLLLYNHPKQARFHPDKVRALEAYEVFEGFQDQVKLLQSRRTAAVTKLL